MTKTLQLAALLLAVAAPAVAYGTLEPVNELGTTLRRNATDPAYSAIDETFASQDRQFTRVRLDYGAENRTWHFYDDKDADGTRDANEEHFNVSLYHARFDGNVTDHLEVNLTGQDVRFRVCPSRATEGVTDLGLARGLRCGGDLDRDGSHDTTELFERRNPVKPTDDRLPLLP